MRVSLTVALVGLVIFVAFYLALLFRVPVDGYVLDPGAGVINFGLGVASSLGLTLFLGGSIAAALTVLLRWWRGAL